MDNSTNPVLRTDNDLHVRLRSVEYPLDKAAAVVSFEMFSNGHPTQVRPHALLRYEVVLNGRGRDDYEQIVATAADRLVAHLKRCARSLTKRHLPDLGPAP